MFLISLCYEIWYENLAYYPDQGSTFELYLEKFMPYWTQMSAISLRLNTHVATFHTLPAPNKGRAYKKHDKWYKDIKSFQNK